jgi:hypothetical protein
MKDPQTWNELTDELSAMMAERDAALAQLARMRKREILLLGALVLAMLVALTLMLYGDVDFNPHPPRGG